MIALIDCNSFYCSAEQVFQATTMPKPTVVLSNNDGCVISRTDSAKALDIPMGAPLFKYQKELRKKNVQIFSSNYPLYADMSNRVMSSLKMLLPKIEIYSIDEAFAYLNGFPPETLESLCLHIKDTILQWTGIPVSIGVGPTKTLAKMANAISKKNKKETHGVVCLTSPEQQLEALKQVPVEKIWGIGSRSAVKLHKEGIHTALDLKETSPQKINKLLTIQGARLQQELLGIPCFEYEDLLKRKHFVGTSRSSTLPLTHIKDVKAAVAHHITRAAEKLRKQNSLCYSMTVGIRTSHFSAKDRYSNNDVHRFLSATDSTPQLIKVGLQIVDEIFIAGYEYKKCGVYLTDLISKNHLQPNLFEPEKTSPADSKLMKALDKINKNMGRDTISYASLGLSQKWQMRQKLRSKRVTTNWDELLIVKA